MKRYYVDLRPLPLSERATAAKRLDDMTELATETYENGVIVGSHFYWKSDTEPPPSDILPAGCSCRPA